WDRAVADLDQAIGLAKTSDVAQRQRSQALAELGRWKEALADLEGWLAGKSNQVKTQEASSLALLHLQLGNVPAYEKACAELLGDLESPTPARTPPSTPWPCLLRRESKFAWDRLATVHPRWGRNLRDDMGETTLFQVGVLLRRGRHAEVAQLLGPVVDR